MRKSVGYLRQGSVWVVGTLAFLAIAGCPPANVTPGNSNDNEPTGDLVTVVIVGQGTVDQNADGNSVTLTPAPAEGWLFDGWTGAELPDANANPLTVDATQVDSITANFVEDGGTPSPSDSDGDGVRDTADDCPGTPLGTPVDATGCEATGPDADGDEVPNSADQCPNTAPGAGVNATGCSPAQRDSDGDGVNDADDECPRTPLTVNADDRGCPISQPGTPDADEDTVPDDIDQCGETPTGAEVDANGCTASQLDTDEDSVTDDLDQCPNTAPRTAVDANGCPQGTSPPPPPSTPPPAGCGDGIQNGTEQCDDRVQSATCNANCTTSRCGDGILNLTAGEQCDDADNVPGDGCNATCQTEGSNVLNDACSAPIAVGEGTRLTTNVGATTDGPDEVGCLFFSETQVESDIWFCYTATCTGPVLVSLCGSEFDTKLAVYNGCDCPSASPLACSDDDCGTAIDKIQSRVQINATSGQQYLVRVGGFPQPPTRPVEQGGIRLTLSCTADACAGGTGDCFAGSPTSPPGCGDADCCHEVCALDGFCCDVTWDASCAAEAEGLCRTGFLACNSRAGACATVDSTPGCDNIECCNTVCQDDPFCCLQEWDSTCVNEAESMCFLTCGRSAGDCFTAHDSPGCNVDACCQALCATDPHCCDTGWDDLCVDEANQLCR